MNRAETEMAKKRAEARKDLSEVECRQLDLVEALSKRLHYEMFPEEYDFMMDSISDAKDRRRGKNPMSSEYTEKVNARRKELGVSPLGPDGMATDMFSEKAARQGAARRVGHQEKPCCLLPK